MAIARPVATRASRDRRAFLSLAWVSACGTARAAARCPRPESRAAGRGYRATRCAHADADSFRSLPGAGAACAPRLLAAFGSDRCRFPAAVAMQPRAGIASITVRSGQQEQVRWRWCTNTVRRQTFHEFAGHSVRHCLWAKRFYHQQRTRGTSHHAALRALAFKWIRILWRCWHDHTVYDDARYTSALTLRGAPLTSALRARIHEASPCLA